MFITKALQLLIKRKILLKAQMNINLNQIKDITLQL